MGTISEDPKKYTVILYYGRDQEGRMKKSSKVIRGTLTEARNALKQHEVGLLHGRINNSNFPHLKLDSHLEKSTL